MSVDILKKIVEELENITGESERDALRDLVVDSIIGSFIENDPEISREDISGKHLQISWGYYEGLLHIKIELEDPYYLLGSMPVIFLSESVWPEEITRNPFYKKSFILDQLKVLDDNKKKEDITFMVSGNESIN